jgi:hypothetical protein
MADRQHAHDLLDRLSPDELTRVVRLLRGLVASGDTISQTERKAILEADEWLKTTNHFRLSKFWRSLAST